MNAQLLVIHERAERAINDLQTVRDMVRAMITSGEKLKTIGDLTIRIPEAVCTYHGVTMEQLRGKHRVRAISQPRQIVAYLLREMTNLSWEDIGRIIRRDHSTAINCKQAVENEIIRNPAFAVDVKQIKRIIETGDQENGRAPGEEQER